MAASPARLTRSASKRAAPSEVFPKEPPTTPTRSPKRQKSASPTKKPTTPSSPAPNYTLPVLTGPVLENPVLEVPSRLNFNLEEAKAHLIKADARFKHLMDQIPAKPYEEAAHEHTMLNPFKSLATSILGQQVSWLAAKAITYRFIRLFFPNLPEKQPADGPPPPFPTPAQVIEMPYAQLRTAGLSGRKAEYLLDVAARFADGRLSAEKLMVMSDQEVYDSLVAVRGIGPWSVEMFSMFVLRRPNVLSPGDLGLQKGLLTWFGTDHPQILPSKLVKPPRKAPAAAVDPAKPLDKPDVVTSSAPLAALETDAKILSNDASAAECEQLTELPPPFPASKTLTQKTLQARFNKKVKGNMYLTAEEMEELTASWAPYRSVGLYYMWTIQDGPDSAI